MIKSLANIVFAIAMIAMTIRIFVISGEIDDHKRQLNESREAVEQGDR